MREMEMFLAVVNSRITLALALPHRGGGNFFIDMNLALPRNDNRYF